MSIQPPSSTFVSPYHCNVGCATIRTSSGFVSVSSWNLKLAFFVHELLLSPFNGNNCKVYFWTFPLKKMRSISLPMRHRWLELVNGQMLDLTDVIHWSFVLHYCHNQDKLIQPLYLIQSERECCDKEIEEFLLTGTVSFDSSTIPSIVHGISCCTTTHFNRFKRYWWWITSRIIITRKEKKLLVRTRSFVDRWNLLHALSKFFQIMRIERILHEEIRRIDRNGDNRLKILTNT